MKPVDGIYVSEIYSVLLQKNTLQLNKFCSQLKKDDWECLFEDCNEEFVKEFMVSFEKDKHVEHFIEKFPDVLIAKVYKPRFFDFENVDGNFKYKKDYEDLFLFYKISPDMETLISKINEETISIMQEEFEKEKSI